MAKQEITFRNDLQELERMSEFVDGFGAEIDLNPKDVFAITLSLDELLTNIISYGYTDREQHSIYLSAESVDNAVELVLEDDARPFDPTAAPDANPEMPIEDRTEGGLGIHFVRKMMALFTYERVDGKNRVVLRREITRP